MIGEWLFLKSKIFQKKKILLKQCKNGSDWKEDAVSSVMYKYLEPHEKQHSRLPCPSATLGAYSNSYPSSQWCHPTISSSVIPFSSCLQSFPAWESFQISQLFTSVSQSVAASASASILPLNIQDWFSLGLTGLISLQSKGCSRVFPNTTV